MAVAAQGVIIQINRYDKGEFPNRSLGGREFPARHRNDPFANLD
jgi:hypothetical protein